MTKAYSKIKKDILRESRTPSHEPWFKVSGQIELSFEGKNKFVPNFPRPQTQGQTEKDVLNNLLEKRFAS